MLILGNTQTAGITNPGQTSTIHSIHSVRACDQTGSQKTSGCLLPLPSTYVQIGRRGACPLRGSRATPES
ncbi:hypothetical protein I7I53_09390 [Histoplasma capsulatum var. duboisii H88]|uniref:Uncharacterized protein n=1 Tax=Ajellomyces capsulatus (strain H88) TaxID=544711 RepID=A0A8A1L6N5_AJEC8|nr:hypothetical protein I7I53_09390 [Histoplasma capsulatum var. duboisii H88]